MTIHSSFRQLQPLGVLRDPIMLAGFVRKDGYNTTAVASLAHLVNAHDGELVAEIEAEQFFDFTVTRPVVRREDSRTEIGWPPNSIYRLEPSAAARDVLVLMGTEPHLRWRTFAAALSQFLSDAGVSQLMMLYSWPAPVPHTRS